MVGVNDAAGLGLAVADSHVEGVDDQHGISVRVDGPADDPPAVAAPLTTAAPAPSKTAAQ